MRDLSAAEIEKFASANGVKRIAVENFLSSLDSSIGVMGNTMNMQMDARMYKWNTATQRAIEAGIRAANKPQTIGKFGGVTLASMAVKTKNAKESVKGSYSGIRAGLGHVWESMADPPQDIGTEIGIFGKKKSHKKRR
jgi:hypothetical protein